MKTCYYVKVAEYYYDSDNVDHYVDTEFFVQKLFLSKEKACGYLQKIVDYFLHGVNQIYSMDRKVETCDIIVNKKDSKRRYFFIVCDSFLDEEEKPYVFE